MAAHAQFGPTATHVVPALPLDFRNQQRHVAHPQVVIAEDAERAQPALHPPQDFRDPAQTRPLVDHVTRERHEVGIQLVGPIHDKVKKIFRHASGEVQVRQVYDR